MFIAIAQIKAMRILPFDLRTHAHPRYFLAHSPLLHCFAQPSTDTQSAMALFHDQAAQLHYVLGLQMSFNACVGPSHNDVFQNRYESDAVG